MSTDFTAWVRSSDLPDATVWEVARVVNDAVRKRFGPQVRGTWLTVPSGRSRTSTTYNRKTLEDLRDAFERDHATPSSIDVWTYKTIGWATITSCMLTVSFSQHEGRNDLTLIVHSADKVAAERFAGQVIADVTSSETFKRVGAGVDLRLDKVSANTWDRGGGGDARGGGKILGWLLAIVGAVIATVVGGLVLTWLQRGP